MIKNILKTIELPNNRIILIYRCAIIASIIILYLK
tara:strand:+ start:265 stop:369 length:105 start_codon:yes stop_codon:yes gene_type:complete